MALSGESPKNEKVMTVPAAWAPRFPGMNVVSLVTITDQTWTTRADPRSEGNPRTCNNTHTSTIPAVHPMKNQRHDHANRLFSSRYSRTIDSVEDRTFSCRSTNEVRSRIWRPIQITGRNIPFRCHRKMPTTQRPITIMARVTDQATIGSTETYRS